MKKMSQFLINCSIPFKYGFIVKILIAKKKKYSNTGFFKAFCIAMYMIFF